MPNITDEHEHPEPIRYAARVWRSRRDGLSRPSGERPYVEGRRGNWFPDRQEYRPCCNTAYPEYLYSHCRSMNHVAALCGLSSSDLPAIRKEVRQQDLIARVTARLGVQDPNAPPSPQTRDGDRDPHRVSQTTMENFR